MTVLLDQIRSLVELQKIDKEIYQIKDVLQDKPLIIERLKTQFENTKGHLKELEDKAKTIQLKRKEYELDIKSKEEQVTKANAQLSLLKTNKEYSAKVAEIEHIKADSSLVEEKILLSYDEGDAINKQIDTEKINVAKYEKVYLDEKKKVEDEVRVLQETMKKHEIQRKELTPRINPNYLRRYEKILENKKGLAIVPVTGSSCGGCFMNVNPQKLNSIKMHEDLIECEMCSRILYVEEEI